MALTLGDSSTYVQALIDSGADAQQNLYYIQFLSNTSKGYIDSDLSTALTVRASQLTLPTFSHSVKSNTFMTTSMDVPVAEITGEKQLSISFRVDANYKVYSYLLQQQAVTSVPNLGYAATVLSEEKEALDENGRDSNLGFKIRIYGLDNGVTRSVYEEPITQGGGFVPGSGYTMLYEFRYCWIESLTPLKFNFDTADKQTATAAINFMDYSDPQNLLLTDAQLTY